MALLDVLVGAKIVVADDDLRLVFAWYGDRSIYVFKEAGTVANYIIVGPPSGPMPTVSAVRAAIKRLQRGEE
jgi:hypothetical protein